MGILLYYYSNNIIFFFVTKIEFKLILRVFNEITSERNVIINQNLNLFLKHQEINKHKIKL